MRRCVLRIVASTCTVAGLVMVVGAQAPAGAQNPFAGLTWSVASKLPKGSLTASYVYSIACPSSLVCYAVGGAGQIAGQSDVTAEARIGHSRNGGRTWTWSKAMPNTNLVQIACETTRVCVTVGSTASPTPYALMTTNSGTTWHATKVPAGTATFWSVACTAKACVAGTGDTPGRAGSILSLSGTTRTWEPAPIAWPAGVVTQTAFALTCPRKTTTCYAIATDANTISSSPIGAYVLSSSNAGKTWTVVTSATGASTSEGPTFFSCLSLKVCQYGGQGGSTLYVTRSGFTGSTPLKAERPSTVPVKWGVACLTSNRCELTGAVDGTVGSAATAASIVGPWSAQSLPSNTGDLQDIVCPTDKTCLAAEVGDPLVTDVTSPRTGGILRLH